MKKITLSIVSLAVLVFADANTTKKDEIFREKYLKNRDSYSNDIHFNQQMNRGFDAKSFTDINNTKEMTGFHIGEENKEQAEQISNDINQNIRSDEYKEKIQAYEDYILKDEGMNLQKHTGEYEQTIDQTKQNKVPYKNQFLAADERLIIAISSSVPKNTIINYFEALKNVNTDVMFVLQGFIGNDPKYIMPTINYIQDLLIIDKEKEEAYAFRIDINPKIFDKYNIKNVPAIIFIKNYNPYDEIQGNAFIENKENNEQVFIAYGDLEIKYILEEINKKAKSQGLNKMIKNLNKGFFQ